MMKNNKKEDKEQIIEYLEEKIRFYEEKLKPYDENMYKAKREGYYRARGLVEAYKIELDVKYGSYFDHVKKSKGLSPKEYCERELVREIESRNRDHGYKFFNPFHCCGCSEEAEFQCIEDREFYCKNCAILMNVNNAGKELNDYHFITLLKKQDKTNNLPYCCENCGIPLRDDEEHLCKKCIEDIEHGG